MKRIVFGIVALSSFSAFTGTPAQDIANVCNYQNELGNKKEFKNCVKKGLEIHEEGMAKVFKEICIKGTQESSGGIVQLELANMCKNSLLNSNLSQKEEFVGVNNYCLELSDKMTNYSISLFGEVHVSSYKVFLSTGCINSKL